MAIDLKSPIGTSKYFTWGEALWLPSIKEYHQPSPDEMINIRELCERLDKVREFIGKPFHINCWLRPTSVHCDNPKYNGFNYNALVNGAKNSWHIYGCAVDLYVDGLTVDQFQNLIRPKLEEFELAAEQNGKVARRNWCHLQSKPVKGQYRFFLP